MNHYEQQKDIELIDKIKDDNYVAFEVLFNRYKGKVFYFIVDVSCGDYYMAEEIVQQVFVKLWEIRKSLNITRTVSAYLYTMAKNYFFNAVAQKCQEQIFLKRILDEEGKKEVTVDSEVDFNLLWEDWESIIEKLPPARRNVNRLHYIEHFSQKDIAERLNISENTVEAHIRLSNQFVKQNLRKRYDNLLN